MKLAVFAASLIKPFILFGFFRERIMAGFKIYARIMRQYSAKAYLYSGVGALGDNYIIAKKYNAYIDGLPRDIIPVYVVYTSAGVDIAKDMFGIENAVGLNHFEWLLIFRFITFNTDTQVRFANLYPHVGYDHTGILMPLFGFKAISFAEHIDLFAFPNIPLYKAQKPYFSNENVESIFNEHFLVKNKTVFISTYAKGVQLLPITFWEKLVSSLTSVGFTVCSNSAPDKDGNIVGEILGSVPIFVPFINLVPFIERCGTIIALRNGLQDISESANALNISLQLLERKYKRYYGSRNDIYAMTKYYNSPNMHDLIYTPRTEAALIDKIVKLTLEHTNRRAYENSSVYAN